MKTALLCAILMTAALSGCATVPKTVESAPAGEGKVWGGIIKSGVAEDASFFMFEPNVIGKRDFFPPTVKKVTWWALFQPFATYEFTPAAFTARWYAPNRELYWEESFSGGGPFAKVSLPIKETPAEEFPGRWYVQIYYKGRLIDDKQFLIDIKDRSDSAAAGPVPSAGTP